MTPSDTLALNTPPTAELPAGQALDDPLEVDRYTRWEATPEGRIGHSALQLSGMHCAACAGLIEQALLSQPGVRAAEVSAAARRAQVTWDPLVTRPSALMQAVKAAGYGAVPDTAASARAARQGEHRAALWRLFVSGFCAMQVMMLATPSYVAAPGELTPDVAALLNWGSWLLSLPVLAFSSTPFFRAAWGAWRARRMAMDVPVALGIGVTFVASSGATFDPGGLFGDEVWFDSLTMFVAFLWLGRFLEIRMRHRAAEALEAAVLELPETAWRVDDQGRVEAVSARRLAPGDRVRVPAGATLLADGILLSDSAFVAEALLTGEARPVPRKAGDRLLAGSVNGLQALEMRVERTGADTRHQAIVNLMREAFTSRPEASRLADRWAGPFLWAVLALAGASAAVWHFVDPSRAVPVAVAVLIVTCPCALSLATPATLVAAARGLAGRGLLLRRLEALESMARVDHVCLDKTGTLTRTGEEAVEVQLVLPAVLQQAEALTRASGLAAWSTHPVSVALAGAVGLPASTGWRNVREVPGQGLEGRDESGRCWRLGAQPWATWQAEDERVGGALEGDGRDTGVEGAVHTTAGATSPHPTSIQAWLGVDGTPVARFKLDETLRPGAVEAISALRADGLALTLLSGDQLPATRALGARVGLDEVMAGATPEAKLAHVRALQAAGRRVAMVGDGLNDTPVMAAADVSVAMGESALAARHPCDAVAVSGSIGSIVDLRATAVRAIRLIRQNLGWALVYNATCIPLAAVGAIPPWAAGLGMAASSLAVMLNAQRAASS